MARITGHVFDRDRRPVGDVRVSIGGKAVAKSARDGSFSAPVAGEDGRVALTFSKAGYVSNTRVLDIRATGVIGVVIWPIAYKVGFDPGRDLDVELDGSRIQVPAGALAGPRGGSLAQRARLSFTLFDVSRVDQRAAAPGDYATRRPGGRPVRLRSYGIFSLGIETPDGRPVPLRPGAAIEAAIAVPRVLAPRAPAEIGFYDLQEASGEWTQVGDFTYNRDTLTFNGKIVRTGAPNNLDHPEDVTCVTVQVVNMYDSSPMGNFNVVAHSAQADFSATTNGAGFVCLLVERDASFTVEAHGQVGTSTWATYGWALPSFTSPDIQSGEEDCGGANCPFVGQVPVDLIESTNWGRTVR